jgi:hypothetical protein
MLAQRVVHVVEKGLAVADVGVRVVVDRDAALLVEGVADVVDEGEVGERGAGELVGKGFAAVLGREVQVLVAPERGVRDIRVVVLHAAADAEHAVPHRRQGGDVHRVRDAVGLAGVHVEPIRRGVRQDPAEVAVA